MAQGTKYTLRDMHALAKANGGEFLTGTYINMPTVYQWRCGNPEHPPFTASASNVMYAHVWCQLCHKERRIANLRNNLFEYVEKRNGTIASDLRELVDTRCYVKLQCAKGHEWSARYMQLLGRKSWCPRCAIYGPQPQVVKESKHTLADLQAAAMRRGGECLSTEYSGDRQLYLWKCAVPEHPSWEAAPWKAFRKWCPACMAAKSNLPSIVSARMRKHGVELCSIETYKDAKHECEWKCLSCNGVFTAARRTFDYHIKNGQPICPHCRSRSRKQRKV